MAMAKKIVSTEFESEPMASASTGRQMKTPAWMMRSKYYMLEFILALVAILASAFVLNRIVFSLGHAIASSGAPSTFYSTMSLWMIAMGLVWLPTAVLFFKRSRYEEINRPEVATTKLRRFFLYSFMFIVLLSVVGFKVTALFSLLQIAFGSADTGDTLLMTTVPALLAAWLNAFVFWIFMKPTTSTYIKKFATLFGGGGLVILLVMLLVTAVQARGALVDETISNDLRAIHTRVEEEYAKNGSLPDNLDALRLEEAIKNRANKHSYQFEKLNDRDYRLCANFKSDGQGNAKARLMIYPQTPDFSDHRQGKECFDLSVGYGIYPALDDSSSSSMEPAMGGGSSAMEGLDSLLNLDGQTY